MKYFFSRLVTAASVIIGFGVLICIPAFADEGGGAWKNSEKSLSVAAGGVLSTNTDIEHGMGGHIRMAFRRGDVGGIRLTLGSLVMDGAQDRRYEDFSIPLYLGIGGEAHFGESEKLDSYLAADLNEYFWDVTKSSGDSYEGTDFGLSLGGGTNWKIGKKMSIPLDAMWHWVFMRQKELDVNYHRIGFEVTAGLRWTWGQR